MSQELPAEVHNQIQELVSQNPIMLFMKGNKHFPRCGFSATVVEVLKRMDVEFHAVDVLQDPAIRSGIKAFANWPTIPQLYIAGEFVGGCDIVREMYENGELEALLSEKLSADA